MYKELYFYGINQKFQKLLPLGALKSADTDGVSVSALFFKSNLASRLFFRLILLFGELNMEFSIFEIAT